MLSLRDHLRFVYAGDTSLDTFSHAQIGTGAVPFDSIAAMLRAADVCSPTILEIVADDPEPAIAASVAHLDGVRWPAR
jgi:sugar phosphate isomerase/epimerase